MQSRLADGAKFRRITLVRKVRRSRKILLGTGLFLCVVVLWLVAFARGGVTTRRFHPTNTNEFNLIFELRSPPSPPVGKLRFVALRNSVGDWPSYVYSNRTVSPTNADVLFDPPLNGVRKLRVYKPEAAEWRFQVTRTVTTHLYYRQFWGNSSVGAIKIREQTEVWKSDPLVNEHLQPAPYHSTDWSLNIFRKKTNALKSDPEPEP